MKTIDDALELRGRIFGAFEMAESEPDPEARRAWLTFVVVGGGPTGVEVAGQIAELSRSGLSGNFRRIDPSRGDGRARRRRQGDPGRVRRPALGEGGQGATTARRDGSRRAASSPGSTRSGWTCGPRTARSSGSSPGRRSGLPACRPPRWLGCSPRPAGRRATGPGRIAVLDGLHAARPSRGVRDRRHDGPRRPARGGRGRHAVGDPRREHDQASAPWQGRGDVHLPRPGQHGDHLAVPRGGELQGPPALGVPRAG